MLALFAQTPECHRPATHALNAGVATKPIKIVEDVGVEGPVHRIPHHLVSGGQAHAATMDGTALRRARLPPDVAEGDIKGI